MPSQRGQMIPKGENKWLLRIYLGRDENGKRQYVSKSFEGMTSQARKELTRMLGEKDTDTFVKASTKTVQEYISEWLTGKANVAVSTRLDYQHRMKLDVYPFIGSVRLDKITPAHIRNLYGKLKDVRELSPRTIRYTHTVLSQAFEMAVEDGELQKNPCKRKSVREMLPKKVTRTIEVLTQEEMTTLIDKTKDTLRGPMWRLMLVTGLRPQEALALTWDDIEEHDGATWLSVRKALHKVNVKGKYEVSDETKTHGSKRSLVLDQETADVLQRYKARQSAAILKAGKTYQRNNIVFASLIGTHLGMSNVRRWWAKDCAAAEVKEITLYEGIRHTHGSHFYDITKNAKATAERLGHKDPAMTLRVYTHTIPGTHEAGVLEFSKRLLKKA